MSEQILFKYNTNMFKTLITTSDLHLMQSERKRPLNKIGAFVTHQRFDKHIELRFDR